MIHPVSATEYRYKTWTKCMDQILGVSEKQKVTGKFGVGGQNSKNPELVARLDCFPPVCPCLDLIQQNHVLGNRKRKLQEKPSSSG